MCACKGVSKLACMCMSRINFGSSRVFVECAFHKIKACRKLRLQLKSDFPTKKCVISPWSTTFDENLLTRWQFGGHSVPLPHVISATDKVN